MNTLPNWVTIMSAFISPIVAIVVTYIAIQQYKLQKNKLRLDLFEKRYEIYKNAEIFINQIVVNGCVDSIEMQTFFLNTKDKYFLFGRDVNEYLNELYKNAIKLSELSFELEALPVGKERNEKCENKSKLFTYFCEQRKEIAKNFAKYLIVDK